MTFGSKIFTAALILALAGLLAAPGAARATYSSYTASHGNVQGNLHVGRVFQMSASTNLSRVGLARRQQFSQWRQREAACGVTQNGACIAQAGRRSKGNYWVNLNP